MEILNLILENFSKPNYVFSVNFHKNHLELLSINIKSFNLHKELLFLSHNHLQEKKPYP